MLRLLTAIAMLLVISSSAWAGRCDDKFYPFGLYGLERLNLCLKRAARTVAGEIGGSGPQRGSNQWYAMWGYCYTEFEAVTDEMRILTPQNENMKDSLRGSWTLNYLVYRAMFEEWRYLQKSHFASEAIIAYCLDELAGEAWADQQ